MSLTVSLHRLKSNSWSLRWRQLLSQFHLLLIPALGGAIFGPLIYRSAREAK